MTEITFISHKKSDKGCVIVLPGLARQKRDYASLFQWLETQGFAVTYLNLPAKNLPQKDQLCRDIVEAFQVSATPRDPCILLGESMGGMLGLWCASFLPNIQHVISINPGLKLHPLQWIHPRTLVFWGMALVARTRHLIPTSRFWPFKKAPFITPQTMLTLKSIRDELLKQPVSIESQLTLIINRKDSVAFTRWNERFFGRIETRKQKELIEITSEKHSLLAPEITEDIKHVLTKILT